MTLGLHRVSEEGQKTITEEGRKEEDRQEAEAKQFSESKHKFRFVLLNFYFQSMKVKQFSESKCKIRFVLKTLLLVVF